MSYDHIVCPAGLSLGNIYIHDIHNRAPFAVVMDAELLAADNMSGNGRGWVHSIELPPLRLCLENIEIYACTIIMHVRLSAAMHFASIPLDNVRGNIKDMSSPRICSVLMKMLLLKGKYIYVLLYNRHRPIHKIFMNKYHLVYHWPLLTLLISCLIFVDMEENTSSLGDSCSIKSPPPEQYGRHFADDIFNCIFLK